MPSQTYNGIPIEAIVKDHEMDPDLVERIAHRKVPAPKLAIVEPDPQWPSYFQSFKDRILEAFGQESPKNELPQPPSNDDDKKVTVQAINHVGSTSVPNLPAKAVVDIDLVLSEVTLPYEPLYVPVLEKAGFQYLLREPAWHEHRFFAAHAPMSCNLHVFGPLCPEVERHLIFRNWLRKSEDDRELYARVKRECAKASREKGEDMMAYTERKESVIREIRGRAFRDLGIEVSEG